MTFKEMLATEEGKRKLNKTIRDDYELSARYRRLVKYENQMYISLEDICNRADMSEYDVYTPEERAEHNSRVRELGYHAINDKVICELMEKACIPLQYEAYKILCERGEVGD